MINTGGGVPVLLGRSGGLVYPDIVETPRRGVSTRGGISAQPDLEIFRHVEAFHRDVGTFRHFEVNQR